MQHLLFSQTISLALVLFDTHIREHSLNALLTNFRDESSAKQQKWKVSQNAKNNIIQQKKEQN
jgi:hypothetical protein